ncbi:MAG: hypothetical protein H6581_03740 [Bacteroidia bacterium]|nr:hypothetical protein [Bacteroidia bacterium]
MNPADHIKQSEIKGLSITGEIAFSTLIMEIANRPFANPVLNELINEIWFWLGTERSEVGKPRVDREWPSFQLYERFAAKFVARHHPSGGKERPSSLFQIAYSLLLFVCWSMDGAEATLFNDKPVFLPSDVAESGYDCLWDGINWACKSGYEQTRNMELISLCFKFLQIHHPQNADNPIGYLITRADIPI